MPPDDALLHRVRVALGGAVEVEEKKSSAASLSWFEGRCVSASVETELCAASTRPFMIAPWNVKAAGQW